MIPTDTITTTPDNQADSRYRCPRCGGDLRRESPCVDALVAAVAAAAATAERVLPPEPTSGAHR